MATKQSSLPFGTTNTTDDVVLVTALALAGGGNDVHVFSVPFESAPQLLSGISEGATSAVVTAVATSTQVTVYSAGAGGAEDVHVMLRGQLKSTSDKLP